MAETSSLLNCRRSNPTTSSNLVLSAEADSTTSRLFYFRPLAPAPGHPSKPTTRAVPGHCVTRAATPSIIARALNPSLSILSKSYSYRLRHPPMPLPYTKIAQAQRPEGPFLQSKQTFFEFEPPAEPSIMDADGVP